MNTPMAPAHRDHGHNHTTLPAPSEIFRARLREVRRRQGWTQQQIAEAPGVNLDASAITRLERGTRGVMLDDVITISAALGVSPLHMIVPLENDADLEERVTDLEERLAAVEEQATDRARAYAHAEADDG